MVCSLLLELNHGAALQEQSPPSTVLYREFRRQFILVFLSFPLHVGAEAGGSRFKEIK